MGKGGGRFRKNAQVVHVGGVPELENHHSVFIITEIGSGQNCQWILIPGEVLMRSKILYGLKVSIYKLLISCKKEGQKGKNSIVREIGQHL